MTFWFTTPDGARLYGAVLGSGSTGVVLATQVQGDVCAWLPEALVLRSRGFRVLLFDFRGFGLSGHPPKIPDETHYVNDVVAAAKELRARGATASIVAADRVRPKVAGVVSLSGEADLRPSFPGSDLNAIGVARRLTVPLLYMASRDDGLTPPEDVAKFRAALEMHRGSTVAVFRGGWHGWSLLYTAPYRQRVAALVEGFLAR